MINFYSDIKVSKGFLCSTIIDLSKKCFYQLSNNHFDNLLKPLGKLDKDVLDFLSKNELVNNFEQQIDLFIPLDLSYDKFKVKNIDTVFIEFASLHLKWFNLTFFKQLRENINLIINVKKGLKPSETSYLIDVCNDMVNELPIDNIQIIRGHNVSKLNTEKNDSRVIIADPKKFPLLKTELNLYIESLYRNTYFNRNVFINSNGEIKNAFDNEKVYGVIFELNDFSEIFNITKNIEFQKYWSVDKDSCDICKDCEFRNICIDNRLPHQRKDKTWYHLEECNYNPYICKWEDEKDYQSLSKCGVVSDANEFSINHEKITEINKNLWEEK